MPAQQPSGAAANALLDLIGSHRITAAIYVATRLGVADLLAEGPQTARQLAERSGAHEPSLRRLLRALVSVGVCARCGTDRYELTPLGAPLAAGAPQSLKAVALFEGEMLWRAWGGLIESVRSGKNGAELAGLDNSFDLMGRSSEAVATFNAAMVAFTRAIVPDVLAAYDFAGVTRLLDVGGGYGELLGAILQAHPSMHGAIFDLPRCAEGARAHLADVGVGERAEFTAGNFFESVPGGADAIIMKSILHDWTDERCTVILTNCRRALPRDGRLLVVERLMPEELEVTPEHRSVTLSDLNMLRGPGGCERTEGEYRALLEASGFRMTRALPAGRAHVIEATVA
jgi:ubiquinone/menaquinone biosynthesis C-methylase UbiE